jgi:hypothetical protein
MYKQKNDFLEAPKPCPVCGGQEFEWGRLAGGQYGIGYVPGFSMWQIKRGQAIKVRRCLQCNNLLQFTDEELTNRNRRAMTIILVIAFMVLGAAICFPVLLTALFGR